MCVRSRTGFVIPELTVRVARASNPRGTTAMAIRDHLNGLWNDEDFEEWYPRDGKPGLSPAQLATVSVLQFLLELSDRQAAESVRNRIDFKYALGMELEDPGFHHSVLADFRERLAEEGRADKLLDLALEKIRAIGLVRERGRQRTDSTHVLAAVRDLTRLELVTEAMRAALEELARRAPHELVGLVTEDWGKRYGRAARLGKNPSKPKPGSRTPARTSACSCATSTATCPTSAMASRSRPCARSSCRTTSSTPRTARSGGRRRTPACRPRPSPSSRPTT
ncbi:MULTISPECIES: transposase [unclassified Streptomyces]|uniref:transposase n=1 Tax=unclassified Streptomyces TaxID=2593676 RepID=UPI0037F4815A